MIDICLTHSFYKVINVEDRPVQVYKKMKWRNVYMKKKTLAFAMTSALALGAIGSSQAFAANDEGATTKNLKPHKVVFFDGEFAGPHDNGDFPMIDIFGTEGEKVMKIKPAFPVGEEELGNKDIFVSKHGKSVVVGKNFENISEMILTEAKDLGIETEGKELEEIAKEVRETNIKNEAKELGIETDGKEIRELVKEISETNIKNKAKELGIETKGKELKEIAKEVSETLIKNEAKKLGIETEGKELKELAKEIRETHIKNEAKELGIETAGKELNEIAKEVHEKQIMNTAEKLNIDTTNKTVEEIAKEIMTKYPEEMKHVKAVKIVHHHVNMD